MIDKEPTSNHDTRGMENSSTNDKELPFCFAQEEHYTSELQGSWKIVNSTTIHLPFVHGPRGCIDDNYDLHSCMFKNLFRRYVSMKHEHDRFQQFRKQGGIKQFFPDTCRQKKFTFDELGALFENRTIFFTGDSESLLHYQFFTGMLSGLWEHPVPLHLNQTGITDYFQVSTIEDFRAQNPASNSTNAEAFRYSGPRHVPYDHTPFWIYHQPIKGRREIDTGEKSRCLVMARNIIVCWYSAGKHRGRTLGIALNNTILTGGLKQGDILVANAGLHYKKAPMHEFDSLVKAALANKDGPTVLYRETTPQFFPAGHFTQKQCCSEWTDQSPKQWGTIAPLTHNPFNQLGNLDYNIPVMRIWRALANLGAGEMLRGRCRNSNDTFLPQFCAKSSFNVLDDGTIVTQDRTHLSVEAHEFMNEMFINMVYQLTLQGHGNYSQLQPPVVQTFDERITKVQALIMA